MISKLPPAIKQLIFEQIQFEYEPEATILLNSSSFTFGFWIDETTYYQRTYKNNDDSKGFSEDDIMKKLRRFIEQTL